VLVGDVRVLSEAEELLTDDVHLAPPPPGSYPP
jgi:hypothetical protein